MKYPVHIGIVGGGQLGKMLTLAAKKMGFFVTVTDPTIESPAGQVADHQIVADYKDEKAIRKLSKISDVITFEIELANDSVLADLLKKGKSVRPNPTTLSIIRDKFKQKEFLKKNSIPTSRFVAVESLDDIVKAGTKFGYPLLLKARTDAYDGRGNALIRTKKDITKGMIKLQGRRLYVEQYVPFVKELAIMVARSANGKVITYPVVETIHKNNICDTVIAPAQVSNKTVKNADNLAKKTMKYLSGIGVFGIEMFLKKDNTVLINEIAPRVHNSGHYTIEACVTSQFEQHIRAISDLPLGNTQMLTKAAVMKNILGTKTGEGFPKGIERALKIPGVSFHMYNKKEARTDRKLGHITVVGDSIEECLKKVNKARKELII